MEALKKAVEIIKENNYPFPFEVTIKVSMDNINPDIQLIGAQITYIPIDVRPSLYELGFEVCNDSDYQTNGTLFRKIFHK